jgi:3'-5' exoribonuclease
MTTQPTRPTGGPGSHAPAPFRATRTATGVRGRAVLAALGLALAAALLHDAGRTLELTTGPSFTQTPEGRLLGHVHLGLRLIEERAGGLNADVRAELLHAVAGHHDVRAARTAEAAVLYHANQLDAAAAIRPVQTAA